MWEVFRPMKWHVRYKFNPCSLVRRRCLGAESRGTMICIYSERYGSVPSLSTFGTVLTCILARNLTLLVHTMSMRTCPYTLDIRASPCHRQMTKVHVIIVRSCKNHLPNWYVWALVDLWALLVWPPRHAGRLGLTFDSASVPQRSQHDDRRTTNDERRTKSVLQLPSVGLDRIFL